MGDRSQIYIRGKFRAGYDLVALYYQWNYRSHMITRAAQIISRMKDYGEFLEYYTDLDSFNLSGVADVDLDCNTVEDHIDIKQEAIDYLPPTSTVEEINRRMFLEQELQNGQLFVDISKDGIKYAFVDDPEDGKILNAKEYLVRFILSSFNNEGMTVDDPEDWITAYQKDAHTTPERKAEIIKYSTENIKLIEENATLMTPAELQDFLTCDYNIKPTGKGFFESLYRNLDNPIEIGEIFGNHFENYQFSIPDSTDTDKLKEDILTALKKYRIFDDTSYAEVEADLKAIYDSLL